MEQRANVLVVEDDPNWQSPLTEILESEGFNVWLATNYEEATVHLERQNFDLAVLDVSLVLLDPGNIDGIRVMDRLSSLGQSTPAILVSGYATVDIVKDALAKYNIIGVMRKEGWDLQQFLGLTRQALGDAVRKDVIVESKKREGETIKAPVTLPSTGCRILIVEDDQAWQKLLGDFLCQEGHAVETVTTYLEATAVLERASYDLAVVDFNLSSSEDPKNVDGYELLGYMREKWLPVILVTGLGERARPLVLDARRKYDVCFWFDKADFSWPRFREAVYDAIQEGEWFRKVDNLTRRQRQVYDCIRQGLTTSEDIAKELCIKPKTVRNHVSHILKKLGLSSRAAIAAHAQGRRWGHEKDT